MAIHSKNRAAAPPYCGDWPLLVLQFTPRAAVTRRSATSTCWNLRAPGASAQPCPAGAATCQISESCVQIQRELAPALPCITKFRIPNCSSRESTNLPPSRRNTLCRRHLSMRILNPRACRLHVMTDVVCRSRILYCPACEHLRHPASPSLEAVTVPFTQAPFRSQHSRRM